MSNKVVSGIYMIKNKLNNKCYIGQSVNIYDRWSCHKKPYTIKKMDCPALYGAFKKYGLDNFKFEIICEANEKKLNKLETLYIKKYDSKTNGYNCTFGGDAERGSIGKKTYKHDKDGNIIEEFPSLTLAAMSIETTIGNLGIYAKGKSNSHFKCKGNYWSYTGDVTDVINREKKVKEKNANKSRHSGKVTSKKLYQYSLNGELLNNFNNSIEAGKSLNISASSIRKHVNKREYSNFIFSHKKLNINEIYTIRQ